MKKLIIIVSLIAGCACVANAQTSDDQKQQYANKIAKTVEKDKSCTTSTGTKGTWVTTSRDIRTTTTSSTSNTRNSGNQTSTATGSANLGLTNSSIGAQQSVSYNSGNNSKTSGTVTTTEVNEHQTCVEKKH